jgi:hypothetical protein
MVKNEVLHPNPQAGLFQDHVLELVAPGCRLGVRQGWWIDAPVGVDGIAQLIIGAAVLREAHDGRQAARRSLGIGGDFANHHTPPFSA